MSNEQVMPPTAWELYHACFKEGEEVIVITDGEDYHWGKLETVGEEGCRLHRAEVKDPPLLKWRDVSFMSHDGFPIRTLQGADGSRVIEKLDTTDTQGAVRALLTKDTCSECETL
ncbi:MAG: hypothetical protein LN409_03910, partial [Candidatus Thermoplasmatota archaeon]|nr:hypothetical protein [Candidatus Thermoplasmatota archaeon]